VAPAVSYRSETACASRATNISLASSWTPGGLPIAHVRWLAGKADRDYQPAGSNEISPHALFDSHLQCEMGMRKKVADGSTASGNVEVRNRVAVALKLAILPLSLWRKMRTIRSKTYVHSPV
jgi:hypothetical protein